MAEVVLAAEIGRPVGSRAVRRLRREGKIPGVIYGHGTDPLPVAVVARELRVALNSEAGANQLLSLDTGSGTYLTIARDMQRHPVAQTVTHVDFVIVRRDEVISADVPITVVGEATEVHHGDGLVEQQMFTLPINALPEPTSRPRSRPTSASSPSVARSGSRTSPSPPALRPTSTRRRPSSSGSRRGWSSRRSPSRARRRKAQRARPPRSRSGEAAEAASEEG